MLTSNVTTGTITLSLSSLLLHHWARMWEDVGRLASEEMPSEHKPPSFFYTLGYPRSGDNLTCQCFPCRAWRSYKLATTPVPSVGRNEPCPCGAGRKYKRCHGRLS